MRVDSPPKAIVRPSRLIEDQDDTDSAFESTRTCGVGEYGYGKSLPFCRRSLNFLQCNK